VAKNSSAQLPDWEFMELVGEHKETSVLAPGNNKRESGQQQVGPRIRRGGLFFSATSTILPQASALFFQKKGEGYMVKKLFTLLCTSVLVFLMATPMVAQEGAKTEKMAQDKKTEQARWEGIVSRKDSEKSTLDVRKRGGNIEKTIHYDSSTKWTSQEHGSKKVNIIDASQVKDGDRVICVGTYDDKSNFHATLISKRLTN
jgi:hypothetical protein